jgi:hypothetical protein
LSLLKDPSEIRSSIIGFLDSRGSGIRTEVGEPIVDLVDAVSLEAARINIKAEYVRRIGSISGWRNIVSNASFKQDLADSLSISATTSNADYARRLGAPSTVTSDVEALIWVDLSNYAASLGRPRLDASYSTGTERLYLNSSDPYSLPKGATVKTKGSNQILFDTTADLVSVSPGWDNDRSSYYVDVSIVCRTPGKVGQVVRGSITGLVGSISGVMAVSNLSNTSGGAEAETNEQLLTALEGVLSGSGSCNTLNGIKQTLLNNGARDVAIVGPGSSLMLRSTAGAVDAWVMGTQSLTQTVLYEVLVDAATFVLPYQPASEINSVAIVGGDELSSGGGYEYVIDDGVYAKSAQGRDSIVFSSSAEGGPTVGDIVQVNYTSNSLIRSLQRVLDVDPEVNIPGSSILAKEATQLNVVFEMTVVVLPDVDATVTQQAAEAAVQDVLISMLSDYAQNEDLDYSDALVAAAETEIDGNQVVDRIDGFKMAVFGKTPSYDNIVVADNEYVRVFTCTFYSP